MVEDCGMSDKIGPIALASPEKRGDSLNREADEEISKFLRAAYDRVGRLLRAKERELHVLAAALLERETLTQQEIKQIVFGEPAVELDADRPHDAGGLEVR
jgi:ATP-dependent metalloprotease